MLLLQVSLLRDDGSDGGQGFASLPHGPGVGLPAHMPPVVVGGRPSHALSTRGVELDVEVGAAAGGYLSVAAVDDDESILVLAHHACRGWADRRTEEQMDGWMDG